MLKYGNLQRGKEGLEREEKKDDDEVDAVSFGRGTEEKVEKQRAEVSSILKTNQIKIKFRRGENQFQLQGRGNGI